MCVICQKFDDFSVGHMEVEIKKLKREDLQKRALKIKESIKNYQLWAASNHIDGWEKQSVENTIDYLRQAQYLINRFM